MPHPAGTRLAPYEILAPIGAGVGEAYRARDTRLDRTELYYIAPDLKLMVGGSEGGREFRSGRAEAAVRDAPE